MLNKSFTRRLFVLSFIKIILLFVVIARLFYLQIRENSYFSNLSNKNRISHIPIIPKRGVVFDYFKNPIAINTLVWELLFTKSTINRPIEELLNNVNKFIKLNPSEQKQIVNSYKKAYSYESILIKSNLSNAEIATIEAYHSLLPEVFIASSYQRTYLYPKQSAHIIGYIGPSKCKLNNKNVNNWYLGKYGIELSLDTILKGDIGYKHYEINSKGKIIKQLYTTPCIDGRNITLTIDIELQNAIYQLIKNLSASAVVIDIESGEILACVSTPSFDTNKLIRGISNKEWQNIVDHPEKPLNNRALTGLYPPASTLKPFIALIALEKNIIDEATLVECKGYIDIGNRRFHCWQHRGHGVINLHQAIIYSCDVFFYKIGIQLKKNDFIKLGKALKVSDTLLSIFPTKTKGNLPLKSDNPSLGELANSAIGQGEWLVTPLHLANMSAIIANNGFIKELKLLKEIDYKHQTLYSKTNKIIGNLAFSTKNISLVHRALGQTIKNSNYNWVLCGKTGTAQVVSITQEQRMKGKKISSINKHKEHAIFMGYLPFNKPKYAISVVREHSGFASIHAVPIARNITNMLYERHNLYEESKLKLKYILDA